MNLPLAPGLRENSWLKRLSTGTFGRYNARLIVNVWGLVMSEHDRIFFKNFSFVIGILVLTTIVLILYASHINSKVNRPVDTDKIAMVEDRIRQVGDVYTSDSPRPAVTETVAAAFGGSLDGAEIYNNVCTACHTAGIAGSPKMVAAEWEARLEQGMDTLVDKAIAGFTGDAGYMPPRGGKMDLTDEQVRVTVQWMVDNLE